MLVVGVVVAPWVSLIVVLPIGWVLLKGKPTAEDQPLTIAEESEAMSETKDVAIKSQEKYIYHIRFSLTKSDGSPLTFKSFNEQELEDIRSCMTFSICFEPDTLIKDEVKITRILIHYDGVTKEPGLDYGYEFEGISLSGYPAPIVTFELNKEVDSDEFRKSIWMSHHKLVQLL